MKRIPIDKASAAQLAAFAGLNLGLEIEDGASAAKVRAVIARSGYDKDFIELAGEAERAHPPLAGQSFNSYAEGTRPTKVKILIQRQSGNGNDQPVPIGVNGSVMFVPRGVEVEIPWIYYHALSNAVQQEFDPDDQDGLKKARDIPTYPYSVIGMS